jgi:aspartate dehydrogenase
MKRRVALIGYGAIGQEVVAGLLAGACTSEDIAILLRPDSASCGKVPEGIQIVTSVDELNAFSPDIVVETAGHEAVKETVPKCIEQGWSVLVTSIGALHDADLRARLVAQAEQSGARIILPSGALGGLDYVRALRSAANLDLKYESRKPPSAWQDELMALGHDPKGMKTPVNLFTGSAGAAAQVYPLNLNVAAALALSGHGFESTSVKVICDPAIESNIHRISATSELGTIKIEIINRPSPDNPKTSWIVGRSVLAAIDQFFSPVLAL